MDSMAPQPDPTEQATVVRLPASGNTACALDLRVELVLAAQRGQGTEIDASAVQTVGQAVLQLLAAARREATATGAVMTFSGATPEFRDRVADCRMNEIIGFEAGKDET